MGESNGKPGDEPVRTKSPLGWVTDFFGDSVVTMDSACRYRAREKVGGDARSATGNRSVACSGNEARREGNRAEGRMSRTSSSQGNGR